VATAAGKPLHEELSPFPWGGVGERKRGVAASYQLPVSEERATGSVVTPVTGGATAPARVMVRVAGETCRARRCCCPCRVGLEQQHAHQ
jgi:hypothetical protein